MRIHLLAAAAALTLVAASAQASIYGGRGDTYAPDTSTGGCSNLCGQGRFGNGGTASVSHWGAGGYTGGYGGPR